jgi:hypothetical protein
MVTEMIEFLASQDPEVGAAVKAEYDRQRRNIELIASENFVSPAVMAAASTVLTNKYAEGYPGKRYYGGCQCVESPKIWPATAPRPFSAPTTPMSNRTAARRPTTRFIRRCASWGIP